MRGWVTFSDGVPPEMEKRHFLLAADGARECFFGEVRRVSTRRRGSELSRLGRVVIRAPRLETTSDMPMQLSKLERYAISATAAGSRIEIISLRFLISPGECAFSSPFFTLIRKEKSK